MPPKTTGLITAAATTLALVLPATPAHTTSTRSPR